MVGKAEILDKGQNPRFVVTNLPVEGLPGEPEERLAAPALYEKLYCARGEMENRIKEAQQDLFADRTSTSWMASNQLRLWFSAFAHLMVSVLRAEVLAGTDLARATIGQIRLKLFKIATRIKISCRRIHLELTRPPTPIRKLSGAPGPISARCRRAELQTATSRHKKKRADFSSSQRTLPKTPIHQAIGTRYGSAWPPTKPTSQKVPLPHRTSRTKKSSQKPQTKSRVSNAD